MDTKLKLLLTGLLALIFNTAAGETLYKPFVLASVNDTGLEEQTQASLDALQAAGFEVAGQYSPLDNTNIIVVTNEAIKKIVAKSDRGGYAAGQRVSLRETNGKTEVAFSNPLYFQHAFRLAGDMQPIYKLLSDTLGNEKIFGVKKKKMTAKKLAKYHYMIGMQRFDDPSNLGEFETYEAAVAAVEANLSYPDDDGLSLVYRIDIPGKQQTIFGVGMKATNDDQIHIDEHHQMQIVDFDGHCKAAYLPYEVLVNGKQVEALHMRFRMAVHFPDLSMTGKHGFTKLMKSPKAIERALTAMVNAESN